MLVVMECIIQGASHFNKVPQHTSILSGIDKHLDNV